LRIVADKYLIFYKSIDITMFARGYILSFTRGDFAILFLM